MTEGWGARLLSLRDRDGGWAGGACFPAGFDGDFSAGQPWTSTLPTLTLLHTTICVLDGLREHERATGGSEPVARAQRRGEAYLLERSLLRGLSTGQVVDPAWLQFSFPTWWHYDVLWALDHLRAGGGACDPRAAEALELVRAKRRPDGTWPLENTHRGAVHFVLEDGDGRPSRWNTLRAMRVLAWAERVS